MDDALGCVFWVVAAVVVVIFSVYFFSFAAMGGVFFGGGVAILNYGKSFKRNIID